MPPLLKSIKPTGWLHVHGFLLLANWLWLVKLSHARDGVGVGMFLVIMGLAWLGALSAWRLAAAIPRNDLLPRLWVWAVLFQLVGFVGAPVLEDDFNRYLWDGRQFALTGNPYATAPAEHFSDPNLPAAFVGILDGINHPHVPTIYGPVSEVAFAISYWIAPAQLWPLKLMLVAASLLTVGLLLRLAEPGNVLLFAWCPLLIKETAFTAHPDSLAIFFLVAALYAFRRGASGWVAILSALAVGAKVFAVLLVPFLLWRARKRYWAIFAGGLLACYLPFWLQGSAADLAGLSAFVQHWQFNASLHGVLSWLFGHSLARMFCAAGFVLAWGFLFWRSQRASASELPRGDWIYGLFFLFSAAVNAWYLLWLLPFVVLFPSFTGVTALAAVALAYVSNLNLGGAAFVSRQPTWILFLEYGAIFAALIFDWRRTRQIQKVALEPSPATPAPTGNFLERTLVIIPALNEAECVADTIAYWKQLGAGTVRVVDNGSTDATAQVARAAGAEVLGEPKRGYGAAAWRGLQNPPPVIEWVLFSSADGSDHLSPQELQDWQCHARRGFDLIMGDRVSPRVPRQHLKAIQSFGNSLCCRLIALGWGRRFNDLGSLRLARLAAIRQLNLQDRGFGWNVEMQVRAIEQGLTMVELPVGYHARRAGKSKISGSWRGSILAGWGIVNMLAQLWWTRQPQRLELGVSERGWPTLN